MHAQNARGLPLGKSYLFTLRVWPEGVRSPEGEAKGEVEWRGRVQHVENGETLYFRVPAGDPGWQELTRFLLQTLGIEEGRPPAEDSRE
jgi:hypothetical protein